jgi:hypothetical protein
MPTSRNLLVPLVLATSGFLSTSIVGAASGGSDSNLEGYVHSPSFAPPGGRPTRTGKTPTKTQAAADQKAKKEVKANKIKLKKAAVVARRADAKTKKERNSSQLPRQRQ